jgi:hypothetical protein
MYLLFDNIKAACESAYALRGEWDGCNGIVFRDGVDSQALQQALASIELEMGKKIEFCREGEYCIWLLPTVIYPKIEPNWFFDIRENVRTQQSSTDIPLENNSFVERLFSELEPGVLVLNAYEYRLSPEIEEAFWRIVWQGRKYGLRTIKAKTREQGLALSHAIAEPCKIVDLFDYQA